MLAMYWAASMPIELVLARKGGGIERRLSQQQLASIEALRVAMVRASLL